jgi:hypothetical protein
VDRGEGQEGLCLEESGGGGAGGVEGFLEGPPCGGRAAGHEIDLDGDPKRFCRAHGVADGAEALEGPMGGGPGHFGVAVKQEKDRALLLRSAQNVLAPTGPCVVHGFAEMGVRLLEETTFPEADGEVLVGLGQSAPVAEAVRSSVGPAVRRDRLLGSSLKCVQHAQVVAGLGHEVVVIGVGGELEDALPQGVISRMRPRYHG